MKNFFSNRKRFVKLNKDKKFKDKLKLSDFVYNKESQLQFSDIGIKVNRSTVFTFKQIEAIKKTLFKIKKKIRVFMRINPTFPLTRKSSESRMGKGKGKYKCNVARVKKNQVIMEFNVLDFKIIGDIKKSIVSKLPVPASIIFSHNFVTTQFNHYIDHDTNAGMLISFEFYRDRLFKKYN